MKKPILLNIKTANEFSVQQVDPGMIGTMDDGIQCLDSFTQNGVPYLIALKKDNGLAQIYEAFSGKAFIKETMIASLAFNVTTLAATIDTDRAPLCLAYDSTSGKLSVIDIAPNTELRTVSASDIGAGATTLATFTYRKHLFFIAYNKENGHVAKYQITVNASPYSVSIRKVWSDRWAQEWTRFSFFQLGAENFFIKTNIKYNKVNIDHFMDDPGEGSHPVLNIDAPAQMVGVNNVTTFAGAKGFPYFATYRSNGEMTFNRIYGNCQGWDTLLQMTTSPGKKLMLTLEINNKNYLMLY